MFFLLFSMLAVADCKNLIDRTDAEKMVAGIPHGKTILKCESKDCVCIDDVRFEISKLNEDGTFSIDPFKKSTLEQEEATKATERLEKEDALRLKYPEVYEFMKLRGIVE